MKKRITKFILAIVFALLALGPGRQVFAAERSYQIESYQVDVHIQEDGSAIFTNRILYNFNGSFNGIFYEFDYATAEQPKDITVAMQSPDAQKPFPFALSTDQTPGTYTLEDKNEVLTFKVYNPVKDERQQVIYQFTVPAIVENYQDVAQFNWKVIAPGWEVPIDNAEVTIYLPKEVPTGDLRAWGHGSPNGDVKIVNQSEVKFTVNGLAKGDFVETRVIFPPGITSANPRQIAQNKLQTILDEEAALHEKQQRNWLLLIIAGVLLAVGGPLIAFVAMRKGKSLKDKNNPNPRHFPNHIYELPAEIPPAALQYGVFRKKLGSEEVTATVMDLVRRKVWSINPTNVGAHSDKSKDYVLTLNPTVYQDSQLIDYERYLVDWFIKDIGNGKEVSFDQIENYPKDSVSRAKDFDSKYRSWLTKVTSYANQFDVYATDNNKGYTTYILAIVANIILAVAIFIITLITGTYWLFLLLLFPLLAIIILAIHARRTLPILTADGDVSHQQWQGFRNMLNNIGNFKLRDVGSIIVWEHYLVYAISFGLADKVMKALKVEFTTQEIASRDLTTVYYTYPWFYHHGFAHSFNNAQATANSMAHPQSSNSSGFGGGFGGGSSGGGGGGGGGGAF